MTKYIRYHHGHFSTLLTLFCQLRLISHCFFALKPDTRQLRGWRHSPGIRKRSRDFSLLGYYAMSPSRHRGSASIFRSGQL